jgi:uncharacterized protein YqfB (UPF0267 family)
MSKRPQLSRLESIKVDAFRNKKIKLSNLHKIIKNVLPNAEIPFKKSNDYINLNKVSQMSIGKHLHAFYNKKERNSKSYMEDVLNYTTQLVYNQRPEHIKRSVPLSPSRGSVKIKKKSTTVLNKLRKIKAGKESIKMQTLANIANQLYQLPGNSGFVPNKYQRKDLRVNVRPLRSSVIKYLDLRKYPSVRVQEGRILHNNIMKLLSNQGNLQPPKESVTTPQSRKKFKSPNRVMETPKNSPKLKRMKK